MRRGWAWIAAVLCIAVVMRYAALDTSDDERIAKRVLEVRGVWCTPKIVEPMGSALRVVCADGKYTLVRDLDRPLCRLRHAWCWRVASDS